MGDCNGDGQLTVNELVVGVLIALGEVPVDQCPALDVNGDGVVSITELVFAVNQALAGCS